MATKTEVKASDHEEYKKYTLISVLIPFVGLLLGISYLTKNKRLDKKLGEHILAVSVLFGIIWGSVFGFLFLNSTTPVVPITTTASPGTVAPAANSGWLENAYDKVQVGMTKSQVQDAVLKQSTGCTETQVMGHTAEACTYGGVNDGGVLVVQFDNGTVTSKAKSTY